MAVSTARQKRADFYEGITSLCKSLSQGVPPIKLAGYNYYPF